MYPREKTGRSEFEQTMDALRFMGKLYHAYAPEYPAQIFRPDRTDTSPLAANLLLQNYDNFSEHGRDRKHIAKSSEEIKNLIAQMDKEDAQFAQDFSNQTFVDDFLQQENEAYSRTLRDAIWRQNYGDEQGAQQRLLNINNLLFTNPGEAIKPSYTMDDWVNSRKKP